MKTLEDPRGGRDGLYLYILALQNKSKNKKQLFIKKDLTNGVKVGIILWQVKNELYHTEMYSSGEEAPLLRV